MKIELDTAKEKLQDIIPQTAAPKDKGDCFFFFLSIARKLSFLSLFSKLEALRNLTRLFFSCFLATQPKLLYAWLSSLEKLPALASYSFCEVPRPRAVRKYK